MSLQFEYVTCKACGADVEMVAEGRPVAGTFATAVVGCTECGSQWQIEAFLRPVVRPHEEVVEKHRRRARLSVVTA